LEEKNRKSGIGMIIFICLLAIFVFFIAYKYFRVTRIEVQGNSKVEKAFIGELTGIKIDDNLFAINKNTVKENINADPYLEYFDLKRIYPSTVRIEVFERTPIAMVVYGDKGYIIDRDANILELAIENDMQLIQIEGLQIVDASVGSKLIAENLYEIDALIDIVKDSNFTLLDKNIKKINFNNVNDIIMTSKQGHKIKFGQSKMAYEKSIWIDAVIEQLREKEVTNGIINVSSGTSATYAESK